MVCCVCCHGSSTSFNFRCVCTYAKITHTYVRLHSCVALHLALSMNAAANFCSPINNLNKSAIILIYLCSWGGGEAFFHLTRARGRGRGREGGREGGRWRVNGRERERVGGNIYLVCCVCCLSSVPGRPFYA